MCVTQTQTKPYPPPAVAEFEMVDLQLGVGAVDHRIVLAPVEL